jgi:hypothetical protein
MPRVGLCPGFYGRSGLLWPNTMVWGVLTKWWEQTFHVGINYILRRNKTGGGGSNSNLANYLIKDEEEWPPCAAYPR